MFSGKRIAAALIAAAGVLSAAHAAAAEESGTVRLVRTFVQDYIAFDHAGGSVTGGALEGVVSVVASSGGPFVAGAHERVTCLVHVRRSEAGIDLESPCTTTAPSGDAWYTMSRRSAGDVEAGGGGPGTMEILGGTGAYAGIGGHCTYEVDYLPDGWLVAITDCAWQR